MALQQARSTRSGPACSACRTRRVGCDRVRPVCGKCSEASRTCSYDQVRQSVVREFKFIDETPHIAASASALQGERVPHPTLNIESGSEQPIFAISASRLEEIENRLEMLTASVRAMQSAEYRPRSLPGGSDQLASTELLRSVTGHGPEPSTEPNNSTLNLGRLSIQGNGRSRFVSGAFWANVCDEATAIDELLREQTRYTGNAAAISAQDYSQPEDTEAESPGMTRATSINGHPMFPYGDLITELDYWDAGPPRSSRYQKILPDIVPELPPKALCDHLFACFRSYYHVIAPVVHIPTTISKYDTFWRLDTQSRRTRAAVFTPLITAILFAGAASCDEKTIIEMGGREKGKLLESLHKLTARTLRCVNFPRTPTLESFAAFMIIQNTCMREEQPLSSCSYAGTVVRIAQMLGCNHDPSRHKITDAVEAETRRRISWSVYYIDTMIALAAGLPPLIDKDHWSVQPISELKDEFIGTVDGIAYERELQAGKRKADRADAENPLVAAHNIFAMGKYDATVVTRDILENLYGEKPVNARTIVETQEQLEKLRMNMMSRVDRLPQTHITNPRDPDLILAKWARLLLSAFADRNWTYLYYPLSRTNGGQNTDKILDHVLSCSRSYLEKIITLTSVEEFGPLQWSWPGIHQPLHAITVLLRHVDEHPSSPTSETSRQVLDEAMSLCSPEGGMTGVHDGRVDRPPLREGGQEVWNLIRRLRRRAWTRAGLDPDILPTRDEIVERVRRRLTEEDQPPLQEAVPAPTIIFAGEMDMVFNEEYGGNDVDPMAYLDENTDWLQWD